GVRRIEGRVIVDASLYPEGQREGGTGFVISPIMINDNSVDMIVTPGAEGAPAHLEFAPQTSYVRFLNKTSTGKAGSEMAVRVVSDVANGDGTHVATIGGNVPADARREVHGYRIPEPSRFAEIVLAEALHERGVVAAARLREDRVDG